VIQNFNPVVKIMFIVAVLDELWDYIFFSVITLCDYKCINHQKVSLNSPPVYKHRLTTSIICLWITEKDDKPKAIHLFDKKAGFMT
jgi:hypothetical protein